jgi:hypothetical protein
MPFSASINLGTVGDDITSVKLYACTDSNCINCTELSSYTEVLVTSFPMSVYDIPEGTITIKADSIGHCNVSQCINIVGMPTSIPTNTPTGTPTPTPTPTSTPIPPTSTPIPPTSTPIPPTSTPIPTDTPTPTPTITPTPTPTSTSTPTPTIEPTIECRIYTVSTTSSGGQGYEYINCDGTPGGGNIGGVSGYDADTFCAQINTVQLLGVELSLSIGESCTIEGVSITANAGAGMEPCIGGTIDDFMSASVYLTAPVTVETNFDVTVYYQQIGGSSCGYPNITSNFASSTSFTVTVLAGESNGAVNACTQGQYFPSGANICGACVTSSNNTIDTITFNNPGGC